MITGVRKVIVPVGDQQAALRFWTETIGFNLVRDDAYGDERWIEVKSLGKICCSCSVSVAQMSHDAMCPINCHTLICSSAAPTSSEHMRS